MKNKWSVRFIVIILLGLLLVGVGYRFLLGNNVNSTASINFKIHTHATYAEVIRDIKDKQILRNRWSFELLAKQLHYEKKIHPGNYLFKPGMSNKEMLRMLIGGHQTPVNVTFNNVRTKKDLAGKLSRALELDSATFLQLLYDTTFLTSHHLDTNTVICLFIPNTYEMYWNISQDRFMERVSLEYQRFWNATRLQQAKLIGLTPIEVSIMASLVQAEQQRFPAERPRIAGLYMNRLKKGMPMENDATLIFAIGDFTMKRVLNVDKAIDSPFNTYKNKGLTPGPINLPDRSSIDAVLNYEKNDYLFLCAKEDFSGFHNFAADYATHQKNAKLYTTALNKRNIYR